MIAEDIAQEAFIKAYKGIDDFEGRSSIETWILRIAVNQCRDYLRSWSYRKLQLTSKVIEVKSQQGTPEEIAIQHDIDTSILDEVFRLSIKYREVILLHYFEDLSTSEISKILSINEGTIRTRLSRALKKLRLQVEEVELSVISEK